MYYKILPLSKNNVKVFFDVYDSNFDIGKPRGFKIRESWEHGVGYRYNPVTQQELDSGSIICDSGEQYGREYDCHFTWEGLFEPAEQYRIMGEWHDGGTDWLYGKDNQKNHSWEVLSNHIEISGPVEITAVDSEEIDARIEFQRKDSETGS